MSGDHHSSGTWWDGMKQTRCEIYQVHLLQLPNGFDELKRPSQHHSVWCDNGRYVRREKSRL